MSGFDLSRNEAELQRLPRMGLGMGVDCLRPNCDLLDLQIDPTRSSLVQLTMGCGYRAFKDDVRDWCKINRAMHCNIRTPSGLPVKMDIGINANRRSESRLSHKCEGEMVHTRTIRFAIGAATKEGTTEMDWKPYDITRKWQNDEETRNLTFSGGEDCLEADYNECDGKDVAVQSGSGLTDFSCEAERTVSRSSSVQSNGSSQTTLSIHQGTLSRLDILISKAALTKPDTTTDEMIEICKSILEDDNRGATHFISSVDLGAKVFYTETVREKRNLSKVSVKGGLEIAVQAGASAGMSHTDQSGSRSIRSGTTATIHPDVEMKTIKTVVKPEQEMVIGCEVSPVWLLVTNKDWRKAMKIACWEYVKEHTANNHFPAISTGRPLVISSGKYFLKVREDPKKGLVLEGTDQCQDASDLYIEVPRSTNSSETFRDPLKNPDSGFYIYHKTNGLKMYLCEDSNDEGTVRLATRIPSPNAYSRLYVEFLSTQSLASLSKWSKEPLHLLRKTAYTKRRQYLVMKKTDRNDQGTMLFFSSKRDDDLQSLCQFTIRNAENKCTVDSDGNKKLCSNCSPTAARVTSSVNKR